MASTQGHHRQISLPTLDREFQIIKCNQYEDGGIIEDDHTANKFPTVEEGYDRNKSKISVAGAFRDPTGEGTPMEIVDTYPKTSVDDVRVAKLLEGIGGETKNDMNDLQQVTKQAPVLNHPESPSHVGEEARWMRPKSRNDKIHGGLPMSTTAKSSNAKPKPSAYTDLDGDFYRKPQPLQILGRAESEMKAESQAQKLSHEVKDQDSGVGSDLASESIQE